MVWVGQNYSSYTFYSANLYVSSRVQKETCNNLWKMVWYSTENKKKKKKRSKFRTVKFYYLIKLSHRCSHTSNAFCYSSTVWISESTRALFEGLEVVSSVYCTHMTMRIGIFLFFLFFLQLWFSINQYPTGTITTHHLKLWQCNFYNNYKYVLNFYQKLKKKLSRQGN